MLEQTGAVVLAGGASSRMGLNKALLRRYPGGPTLIETVVARLTEAGLPAICVATNAPDEYAFLGLPLVGDETPGAGPLAGILAGLEHTPFPRALVVACDMPALNPALIRYMASLPHTHDVIIPRPTGSEGKARVETLHAIYSKACIGPLRHRIAAGKLKAAGLLEDVAVRYVEGEELAPFNPQAAFRNVNTLQEWEAAG